MSIGSGPSLEIRFFSSQVVYNFDSTGFLESNIENWLGIRSVRLQIDEARYHDKFAYFGIRALFLRWWWVLLEYPSFFWCWWVFSYRKHIHSLPFFPSSVSLNIGSLNWFLNNISPNFLAIWIAIFALLICENASTADEVPAFFLKIAKNIPRVGRSEGYDDYFKSRKNLPKLGSHDTQVGSGDWNKQFQRDSNFSTQIFLCIFQVWILAAIFRRRTFFKTYKKTRGLSIGWW